MFIRMYRILFVPDLSMTTAAHETSPVDRYGSHSEVLSRSPGLQEPSVPKKLARWRYGHGTAGNLPPPPHSKKTKTKAKDKVWGFWVWGFGFRV